jgi:hypothetical protein
MNFQPQADPSTPYGQVRRRDRYRYAVAAMTGLAAAGSLTATGWVAGQAAHAWSAQQATVPGATTPADPARAAPQPAAHRSRDRARQPRVVLRDRPTRTRVSTRYVTPAAPVGGGGSVGSTSSHSSHGSAPAPSSGS